MSELRVTDLLPPLGHNNPPRDEPSLFEIAEKKVNDVYAEATLWLDGALVSDQATADDIANLLTLIREAEAFADATRIAEKKPLDEQIAAIQSRYAPLIGNTKSIKGKTVLAAEACKKALAPWLAKLAAEQEAAAKKAREEAEAKTRAAQEAIRAADAANLEARAAAEALVKEAKRADTAANRMEKLTPTAGGAMGRAIGMRSVYTAVLIDPVAAARHFWLTRRDAMVAALQGLADQDVRAGKHAPDAIPGFRIDESKVPV